MATQYCTKCGSILPANSTICTECGTDHAQTAVQSSNSMEYSAPLSFSTDSIPAAPPVPELSIEPEKVPPLNQAPTPDSAPTSTWVEVRPEDNSQKTETPSDNMDNYYRADVIPPQSNGVPPRNGFQQFSSGNPVPERKISQNNMVLIGVAAVVLAFFAPVFGLVAAALGFVLSKNSTDPKPVRILCGIAMGVAALSFFATIIGNFFEIILALM